MISCVGARMGAFSGCVQHAFVLPVKGVCAVDHGYGRGGTPIFIGVFEPLARAALYLTDENGLGSCFGAA